MPMALGVGGLIILEGFIAHRVGLGFGKEPAECDQLKERKWRLFPSSQMRTRQAMIIQTKQNERPIYTLKFPSKSKCCIHKLPEPGFCFILRHKTLSSWQTLYISKVRNPKPVDVVSKCSILLSFDKTEDQLTWEEQLRKHLEVYSYDINISPEQTIESGPATIHITSRFIVITKSNNNNSYNIIYHNYLRSNEVNIYITDGRIKLEISNEHQLFDLIYFDTENIDSIWDTVKKFKQNVKCRRIVSVPDPPEVYHRQLTPYLSILPPLVSAECQGTGNHVKLEGIDEISTSILDSDSEDGIGLGPPSSPRKKCESMSSDLANKCTPYQNTTPLPPARSNVTGPPLPPPRPEVTGPPLPPPRPDITEPHLPPRWPDITNSFPQRSTTAIKSKHETLTTEDGTDLGGSISVNNSVGCIEATQITNNRPLGRRLPIPYEKVKQKLHRSYLYCYVNLPNLKKEDFEKSAATYPNVDKDFEKEFVDGDRYSHAGVFIKGLSDNISGYVNWKPLGNKAKEECTHHPDSLTPPIPSREGRRSLGGQPQRRSSEVVVREKSHSLPQSFLHKNAVELSVSVFASDAKPLDIWTLGVLIIRRQDQASFEKLKAMEECSGYHLMSVPRAVNAYGDISLTFDPSVSGIECLSDTPQVLTIDDLLLLEPSTWIVLEFLFEHTVESQTRFVSNLCVNPIDTNSFVSSLYSSVRIPTVARFGGKQTTSSSVVSSPLFVSGEDDSEPSPVVSRKDGSKPSHVVSRKDDSNPYPVVSRKDDSKPSAIVSRRLESKLLLSEKNRTRICQLLDMTHPFESNWKMLAGEYLDLSHQQIRVLETKKVDSFTEQVLQLMETEFPQLCDLDRLQKMFISMKRYDLLEYLS